MTESLKEKFGFFARWGLMAFVLAMLGGLGYLSVSAARAARDDAQVNVILPDELAVADRLFYLGGYVTPQGVSTRVFVWQMDGLAPAVCVNAGERRYYLEIPSQRPGDFPLTLRGNPYGATAVGEHSALVRVVPVEGKVFLFDVQLLDDPAVAPAVLAAMQQARERGSAAFFWAGNMKDGLAIREDIRKRKLADPVLFLMGEPSPQKLLQRIRQRCNRPPSQVVLVTRDESLAMIVKEMSLRPCLLTASPVAGLPRSSQVTVPENLKEWIARQPIMSNTVKRPS